MQYKQHHWESPGLSGFRVKITVELEHKDLPSRPKYTKYLRKPGQGGSAQREKFGEDEKSSYLGWMASESIREQGEDFRLVGSDRGMASSLLKPLTNAPFWGNELNVRNESGAAWTNLTLRHPPPLRPPLLSGEERWLQWILPQALCALGIQLSPPRRAPCPRRALISGPPTTRVAPTTAVPAESPASRPLVANWLQSLREMPVDFTGYWKMLANENFEEYLRALDVNVALRKIANLLKPDKEIVQDGDHMIIRTLSTFRNYIMDFQVGKEFEEDLTGIDDRKCMTTVSWDGDKLQCVQKGEKEGRGWTQWIEGDELHLEMRVEGVVCKQVFKKVQ
ncbi:hypothetical protein H8959_020899 [Pygathrix nigripes]